MTAETPAEIRARLADEQIREARARLMRAAPANPYRPIDDASFGALQSEMTARMATAIPAAVLPVTAAAQLPIEARAAAGLPAANPKIWSADLKPIPGRVDKAGWMLRVRDIGDQPLLRARTLISVAYALLWFVGREGAGYARVSYEALAKAAKCCCETVRKALRVLEARGLLDTFNTLVRRDGDVRRGANAYGLRGFVSAIGVVADAATSAVTGAADRMGEQLRRYAAVWGLKARKWGLNATAARPAAPSPA